MDERGRDAARALIMQHGWNAVAYQILNPGMERWFAASGESVIGYVRAGGVRVVAGAPVCAPTRLAAVAQEFEASAAVAGERVLFFGAGERLESLYRVDGRHSLVRLGAQPVWDPREWQSILRQKPSLRAQLARATNKGVRVRLWRDPVGRDIERLRGVLTAWLAFRGLPPLGFLVTADILDALDDRRLFVAERDTDPIAFLVATPVPARHGWLIEEWPRHPSAPNGTTHLLVDAAMRVLAAEDARYLTLGLAPLSDRAGVCFEGQSRWMCALLGWIRAHGRRFYNFAGLESFKAGMRPSHWEPIYAIAPDARFSPVMLRAVAGAFSGGAPERLIMRALAGAVRVECRRAARWIRRR